jgi:transcriptional regulator with XRE-family HTH domain
MKTLKIREVVIHQIDLKRILKEHGLSQRQLAKELGISYPFLNARINGYNHITMELWERITKVLQKYDK